MVTVVAIVGIMAGILFPSFSAGVDSIRLTTASGTLASFLNGALNRAERRQAPVEIAISTADNSVTLRSVEPGFERRLVMPSGVRIEAVLPGAEGETTRRFVVMPGGTPPRVGIQIANARGARRIVRVDPITGVPRIEVPEKNKE
jgi:type II secretory pathway pseudopilin PulG